MGKLKVPFSRLYKYSTFPSLVAQIHWNALSRVPHPPPPNCRMEGKWFPFLQPGGCAASKSLDLASVVQTMDGTIHSINYFYYIAESASRKRKRILGCGSYRGIFMIRDTSCSVTKRLSVPEENSWFYYLFSPDFQFRDLRKINKDWAR